MVEFIVFNFLCCSGPTHTHTYTYVAYVNPNHNHHNQMFKSKPYPKQNLILTSTLKLSINPKTAL